MLVRPDPALPEPTLEQTAARLAALLTGAGAGDALADPTGSDLVFEPVIEPRPLQRTLPPADVWAVDGGQAMIADARCLQVVVTRAARARWRDSRCTLEEEGPLRSHLLGCGEERAALAASGAPVPAHSSVDVNLLRDWGEWETVARCVEDAERGGLVLLDGDLQPDWRIPSTFLAGLLERAASRGVLIAGVTKHSSLARGGIPLLGQLERDAEARLGPRAMWWAPVATTRSDVGAGLTVVAARLDPDARFSFRVDLPAGHDPAAALGAISALADDAAFPGYPYPLAVADRLAACPPWLREDAWGRIEDAFDRHGVPLDVRERAFTDRHRLMERA